VRWITFLVHPNACIGVKLMLLARLTQIEFSGFAPGAQPLTCPSPARGGVATRGPTRKTGICIEPHSQAGNPLYNSRSSRGSAIHEDHFALRVVSDVFQRIGVLEE